MQIRIDEVGDYGARVAFAVDTWRKRTSTRAGKSAFKVVRSTLALMCVGPRRCAYCEDSLADEVEHIRPKSFFPELTFHWENYLFACGPCNGPKGNRHGYVEGDTVIEFRRAARGPVEPPPPKPPALIDPRQDDPLRFLDLDLGGVTPGGQSIEPTFEILPAIGLHVRDEARALFTIEVLGLNREVIRVARGNAFRGFRSRLREYVARKEDSAGAATLALHRDGLLATPHLTVFAEMRRQRALLPEIDDLLRRAPEVMDWPV